MNKSPRINIASIRREQIVEAAVAIIAEQGLHNLSLSEIEKRAGMSRGQLTYYFPTKEAILLAVFDRLLYLMYERLGRPPGAEEAGCSPDHQLGGWEVTQHLFNTVVRQAPVSPEFHALQYTFLSQIGYREDFRRRLASLYGEWRSHMAAGLTDDLTRGKAKRPVPPRAMATLIQAILHGLAMQAAADPSAFDRDEVVNLCLDVLGTYLGTTTAPAAPANGTPATKRTSKRPRRKSVRPTPGGKP
ncbi:MAG: TetR/AcrR family transcriptional regulator [Gemmataceae bacterium]|nr:TetR/AcrR family transcriptional regulator [Gemmataceae bacterium]